MGLNTARELPRQIDRVLGELPPLTMQVGELHWMLLRGVGSMQAHGASMHQCLAAQRDALGYALDGRLILAGMHQGQAVATASVTVSDMPCGAMPHFDVDDVAGVGNDNASCAAYLGHTEWPSALRKKLGTTEGWVRYRQALRQLHIRLRGARAEADRQLPWRITH
jgi:hypothetical protein